MILSQVWHNDFAAVAPGRPVPPWSKIKELYNLPGRFYHNAAHIERVIDKSFNVRIGPEGRVALFLHDIFDAPLSQHSVRFSAEYAFSITGSEYISDLILYTNHESVATDRVAQAVQECDLAQIADPDFRFQCELVRREYEKYVTPYQYYNGRKHVMEMLFERPKLFSAHVWSGGNETVMNHKAKENILGEIQRIEKYFHYRSTPNTTWEEARLVPDLIP